MLLWYPGTRTDGAWRTRQILWEDLKDAEAAVGEFGGDNRAGELPRLLNPQSLG